MATSLTDGKVSLSDVNLIGSGGNLYKNSVTDEYKIITKNDIQAFFSTPHNNLYRGANLISEFGSKQAIYNSLATGDLSNFYIGDYIDCTINTEYKANEIVRMIVAGINVYKGYHTTSANHLVLIPETYLATTHKMNSTLTTKGGYAGSDMFKYFLPKYGDAFDTFFDNHVINGQHLVTTSVNTSAAAPGIASWSGVANNWDWRQCKCTLMSEVQVYGSKVWSGGYDIGAANSQLPIFQLRPDKICVGNWYWLSGVALSNVFCSVRDDGSAYCGDANYSYYVRPLILLS